MTYKSGELFLTLNKAVEVAVNQFDVDPVIARQEFLQKCYIPCSDYEKGFYEGLAKCRDIIEDAMSEEFLQEKRIPVSDVRKLEDIVYMHIDSLEGTRNIVEAGMLSAWKEVAEYVDGMLREDGE